MASSDELTAWVNRFGRTFLRYVRLLQLLAWLFLMVFGYYIGRVHFDLIVEGSRTQGRIVDYKEERIGNRIGTGTNRMVFMPVVEFRAGDHAVRFKDWKGSSVAAGLRTSVPVIYRSAEPSVAMIDRPVWNWIPWAPAFLLGFFLSLVAIKGRLTKRPYS